MNLTSDHLPAHPFLQCGLNVAQQEVGRGSVRFGQLGTEIGEDVEIGAQGGAVVHIGRVDARPEEGLASGDALQAGEIDVARGQQIDILLREIVAHDGDDLHRGEIAGGQRDIGGGAAEHAVHFSMRRFHAVVGNGSNND